MTVSILVGDVREKLRDLADASVHCCVTSPPYFVLRDYGVDGQIGLESTPEEFIAELVAVFREVRRVLRDDGTLWLNIGDSYSGSSRGGYVSDTSMLQGSHDGQQIARIARGSQKAAGLHESARQAGAVARAWVPPPAGLKQKDLIGIPWMLAFALRADGWYLRQDIIWSKPNPMPESVRDRCTKAHEYLFLLSKSERYFYDGDAVAEQRQGDEDAAGFRGGCYVAGAIDNGALGRRATVGNRRVRGVPPRHAQYLGSSDQSGLDQVGRGGKRNKRSVWTVATQPFDIEMCGACKTIYPAAEHRRLARVETKVRCRCGETDAWVSHFATFPPELIEPAILAGCPVGGTVLDPFGGAGTTGVVAQRLGRQALLIELNPAYAEIADRRIRAGDVGLPLGAAA